jgi:hypothetical protein
VTRGPADDPAERFSVLEELSEHYARLFATAPALRDYAARRAAAGDAEAARLLEGLK